MIRSLIALSVVGAVARAEPAPYTSKVPPALRCLSLWYAAAYDALPGGEVWQLHFLDGRTPPIPWDDGRAKSFDEKLASPDVEDAFSIPYRAGAIRPVTTENDDPGRIRLDPLFVATYVPVDLVRVDFLGHRLRVHRKVAPAFTRVAARLAKIVAAAPSLRPFLDGLGGTYVPRNIAGTDRPSAHSYGVSLDINVKRSHYWRWQRPSSPIRWRNEIPQAIVDAFEAEGFIWGGRWYHYDTMHFEYRPELLDPRCRESP